MSNTGDVVERPGRKALLATLRPMAHRKRLVSGLVIGAIVLAALISLAIPSTRRRLANPSGQAAVVGVTDIIVQGDWFQNHVYRPAVVQVPAGSTMRWTFDDRGASGTDELVEHNVVGQGWASPVLAAGVYEYTFSTPGIYRYTCTLHSGMDGAVVVTE